MMPLSKQEEFFVPEFSEEEVSIATTEMSTNSKREDGGDQARDSAPATVKDR